LIAAPRVSIGLPVYNGEKYLRLALDSLLAQDYGDFELIIADNASTDGTAEICRQCAHTDRRIRFVRNDRNLGAVTNFNNVFRLSSGEYFMWAAHDDLWHPSYIRRCLEGLGQDVNVVLCASTVQFIDAFGDQIPEARWRVLLSGGYNSLHTRSLPLRDRVRGLTKTLNWYALYGIIRSGVLRETRLYQDRFGGDVILLMELLFHGETYVLDEALFSYRLVSRPPAIESAVTGDSRQRRLGPYTELAMSLLDTIDESCFAPEVKRGLREDLLANISLNNRVWTRLIFSENLSLARLGGPYARSARIRELLSRVSSEIPAATRASPAQTPPTAPA
jgi:glycosyltransferase involved in cell wall biosynthesis